MTLDRKAVGKTTQRNKITLNHECQTVPCFSQRKLKKLLIHGGWGGQKAFDKYMEQRSQNIMDWMITTLKKKNGYKKLECTSPKCEQWLYLKGETKGDFLLCFLFSKTVSLNTYYCYNGENHIFNKTTY